MKRCIFGILLVCVTSSCATGRSTAVRGPADDGGASAMPPGAVGLPMLAPTGEPPHPVGLPMPPAATELQCRSSSYGADFGLDILIQSVRGTLIASVTKNTIAGQAPLGNVELKKKPLRVGKDDVVQYLSNTKYVKFNLTIVTAQAEEESGYTAPFSADFGNAGRVREQVNCSIPHAAGEYH
jgi:hypothetical protein